MEGLQRLSQFIEQAKLLEAQIESLEVVKKHYHESSVVVDGILAGKRHQLGELFSAIKHNASKLTF